MVFGHRAGCYHVALGWNGQPRRWLDEADGHGAQGPEIGATARTGCGHGVIGSHRQVPIYMIMVPIVVIIIIII